MTSAHRRGAAVLVDEPHHDGSALYFPERPRDTRYPYVAMQEVAYRQAHARLMARHAEQG